MAVTGGLRLCAPIEYSIIFTSRRLKPGINKKRNCGYKEKLYIIHVSPTIHACDIG